MTKKQFKQKCINYFFENSMLTMQAVKKSLKFSWFMKRCYFTYNYDKYYIETDNLSLLWLCFKYDNIKNHYYNCSLACNIEKLLD